MAATDSNTMIKKTKHIHRKTSPNFAWLHFRELLPYLEFLPLIYLLIHYIQKGSG